MSMNSVANGDLLFELPSEALLTPDESLVRFAHGLLSGRDNYDGLDRRSEPRYPLCLNILAIPVDENNNPRGEPLLGVTRNISTSGIAILFTCSVGSGLLALQFEDPRGGRVRLLLNVLRCRPLSNFFEVAGTFVSKL
jgi:hypothetical protein